jgi:hypothetical protein
MKKALSSVLSFPILSLLGLSLALASVGCASRSSAPYSVKAYRPKQPERVRVKVSLQSQNIYVLEGDRLLMAAATCVGTPQKPTPKGTFRITSKIEHKRSNSYGFFVHGEGIVPGEATKPLPGKFVGYPMAYWCEFAPAYGFHSGYVHPVPRTHGCLRLHKEVAPKFYSLVREGTPVTIADHLEEDARFGAQVQRPSDYKDPDPAPEFMVSSRVFEKPKGELLLD